MDISFRLDVVESGDDWVVFCRSPYGSTVSQLPAPFPAAEFENRLAAVEKSLTRSAAKLVTRRAAAPERTAHEFGAQISDALLAGDVRLLFSKCREKAREQRQELRILVNPAGPNVCRIPWEFTVDPDRQDDYLALRVPVARSPHLMHAIPPLQVRPPLRVLGVMSRPEDLPALDVERERRDVTQALGRLSSDMVEMVWLDGDRWTDLAEAVRSDTWHVLHFVGHGGFDEDIESGFLELADDQGNAIAVPATDLGRLLSSSPQLRLVVLNACESAVSGSEGVFSSTAAKLMREGVPAVVAMQYEITDDAALAFSSSFYEGLARGLPVDRAVMLARESVKMTMRTLEWATPVLFLASDETRIFAVPESTAAEGATPGQPSVVPPPRAGSPEQSPSYAAAGDWLSQTREKLTQVLRRAADEPRPAPPPPPPAPAHAEPTAPSSVPVARRLRSLSAEAGCLHAAIGPRDLVAVAGADGVVRVISSRTGRVLARCTLPRGERALRVAWSPWPRHVASSHDHALVTVWDLETEVPVRVLRAGNRRVEALAFSGDGRWLAVAGECRLRVFDSSGVQVRDVPVPPDAVVPGGAPPLQAILAVAFTPGDRGVVLAGDDGVVRSLDVHGRVGRIWRHPSAVPALALATDRIATGSSAGRVSTWSYEGRLLLRSEHGAGVDHAAFSTDGQLLATAGVDRAVRIWDRNGSPVARAPLSGAPSAVGFLSDRTILSATQTGELELWAAPDGRSS